MQENVLSLGGRVSAVLALCLACVPVSSATKVGAFDSFNCYPFSCGETDGIGRFQQQYNPAAFSGPIQIQALKFFPDATLVGNTIDHATYNVYLSTSPRNFGAMTVPLIDNVGADEVLFATVTVGPQLPASLVVNGLAPFAYNPANGPLLLRVLTTSVTSVRGSYGGGFAADHTGADLLRNYRGSFGEAANATGGLVTEFVPAVPEPATVALTAAGLLVSAVAARRRRV